MRLPTTLDRQPNIACFEEIYAYYVTITYGRCSRLNGFDQNKIRYIKNIITMLHVSYIYASDSSLTRNLGKMTTLQFEPKDNLHISSPGYCARSSSCVIYQTCSTLNGWPVGMRYMDTSICSHSTTTCNIFANHDDTRVQVQDTCLQSVCPVYVHWILFLKLQ